MDPTIIDKKAYRLFQIVCLLSRHSGGLTTAELAGLCGVHQRTIQRDLAALQEGPLYRLPLVEEGHRWRLMDGASFPLPPVQFELGEATALFLAARLLCRYADETVPGMISGLDKLAEILPAPIGGHIQGTRELLLCRPVDRRFEGVFEAIVRGWATRRAVRIWYRAGSRDGRRETRLCPYFIEPSGIGYATYVIGHASHAGEVRTFKVERIERAELTGETFEVPADFDALELLRTAWRIMYGDEPQEVVLRFSPAVARRVHESEWHPSQEIVDEGDGGCTLRVRVAEPIEMKPWIRGWGPDCAVLAPAWLREEVGEEMRRAGERYEEIES